jgi:hypothetical protein
MLQVELLLLGHFVKNELPEEQRLSSKNNSVSVGGALVVGAGSLSYVSKKQKWYVLWVGSQPLFVVSCFEY